MHTFQNFSELDSQLQRPQSQAPVSQSERPNPTAINISTTSGSYSYPRTFQQPLAMNSPLDNGKFALWPPTPHYPVIKSEHGDNYSYSGAEEDIETQPWDGGSLNTTSDQLQPNGIHIHQMQYRSQQDSNSWDQARSDYEPSLMGSLSAPEDALSSSFGSAQSMPSLSTGEFPFSQSPLQGATLSLDTNIPRRISDDATSLSSVDAIHSSASTDLTYYDDTPSYDGAYMPNYTHRSNLSSWSSATTPLSPMMSPARMSVRSGSRGRGSPSPARKPHRVVPYDVSKRWSTGNSTNYSSASLDPQLQRPQFLSHQSSPVCGPAHPGYHSTLTSQRSSLYLEQPCSDSHGPQLLPGAFYIPSHSHIEAPNSHSSEFSEPPNLYESLNQEPIPPPPEDMNPDDPTKKPHEQDLRFEGDLYTPRWVRGTGTEREGWCGICRPGRWLKLKNSAFWYDKSFSHGISAPSGLPFHEPKDIRRMVGNPDVWEGLCHSCNDWVALASTRKRATTWFRHAYKCHTHDKVKDAPKRRRESSARHDSSSDLP